MLPDPSTNPAGDSGEPGDSQEPGDCRRRNGRRLTRPASGSPGHRPGCRVAGTVCRCLPGRLTRTGSRSAGRRRRCRRIRCWPPSSTRSTARTGQERARCPMTKLIGVIAAVRRWESRVAWYALTAVAQFAALWGGEVAGAKFAPDEVAAELQLTSRSAAGQLEYGPRLKTGCPAARRALRRAAPRRPPADHRRANPHPVPGTRRHRRCGPSGEGAVADVGELRSAAQRMVLKLDPDAAARHKEPGGGGGGAAIPGASGNAGMIARELPPDEVLASWQHVDQRAHDLRAAGSRAPWKSSRSLLPRFAPGTSHRSGAPARTRWQATAGHRGRPGPKLNGAGPGDSGPGCGPDGGPGGSGSGGQPGGRPGRGRAGQHHRAVVRADGQSATPAEAAGYGMLDAGDARDLAAAAARDPNEVVRDRPASGRHRRRHGCAPGRHPTRHRTRPAPAPLPPPAPPRPHALGGTLPARTRRREPRHRTRSPGYGSRMIPITRGRCDHHQAESGYRPSRALAHRPGPQHPVHRTRLRPARRPVRPGPHHRLGPGRPHLRMRSRPAMSPPPSV